MNKELFNKEINEIEVPSFEVFSAINKGLEKGRMVKSHKKRKAKSNIIGVLSAAAATAFFASGFIFAPVTNVLADVPLVGSFYEKHSMQIGESLQKNNLITKLNEKATSNGVEVTLTSTYYDGNVLGVTFIAEGDRISLDGNGTEGPESGYSYHLFSEDDRENWSGGMTMLTKTKDGHYTASMEFYNNRDESLPKTFKLPLVFTNMGGIKGSWKFEVPVKQLPIQTIPIQGQSHLEGYSIKMDSIHSGKATTLLKYKTTSPFKEDEIEVAAEDSQGKRLLLQDADTLSTKMTQEGYEKRIRGLITSRINSDANYLTVQPVIRRKEKRAIKSLNNGTPFMIESSRLHYKLNVNKISQNGNKLFVNYSLENVNKKAIRKDILQNFAETVNVVKSKKFLLSEKGDIRFDLMEKNRLSVSTASLLQDNRMDFQSTYILDNQEDFDIKDYSLVIPFDILSLNDPINMNPIKVELNK